MRDWWAYLPLISELYRESNNIMHMEEVGNKGKNGTIRIRCSTVSLGRVEIKAVRRIGGWWSLLYHREHPSKTPSYETDSFFSFGHLHAWGLFVYARLYHTLLFLACSRFFLLIFLSPTAPRVLSSDFHRLQRAHPLCKYFLIFGSIKMRGHIYEYLHPEAYAPV